ncbi:MAG TPA: histidine kinase [Candidatus Eisenbergiella intestinipullorum]|nr:histidine kinase [Candidatus Eisenbergiella intestinipullorum]
MDEKEKKDRVDRKKRLSLKNCIFIYWLVLLGIFMTLMVLYGGILLKNSRNEILDNADTIAEHYGMQIDKDIFSMMEAVNAIYVNNLYYMKIRTRNLDDYEWIGAAYYLERSLGEKADSLDYMGGMFFYDEKRNSMRSVYSDFEFSGIKTELDREVKKVLEGTADIQKKYSFTIYEGECYLIYFFKTGDQYLGFVINLDRYFEVDENLGIFYVFQRNVIAECGKTYTTEKEVEKALNSDRVYIGHRGDILIPVELENLDLELVFSFGTLKLSDIWKKPDLWMFVILTPVISFVFFIIIYYKIRSIILHPIEHITFRINEMKEHEKESGQTKKTESVQIEEFVLINKRIDEVLEQMIRLQKDKFEEEQRVREVQMQYYQLQINPHFFLNCMNTISLLLNNHSLDAANDMIRSFSSYFRYIFRDQKKPVTVEKEIREIRAYCNIYSLKGGFPILLQTDVKEEAAKCQIPILCIQTFVENSVKYAAKAGGILKIKIQAGIISDEAGGRRLSICISDNGSGYPDEMLEELNRPVMDFQFRSYHVGIDNLKYRIYLMYQETAKWYFYNSPYGGAISEITLPEVKTENESFDY